MILLGTFGEGQVQLTAQSRGLSSLRHSVRAPCSRVPALEIHVCVYLYTYVNNHPEVDRLWGI